MDPAVLGLALLGHDATVDASDESSKHWMLVRDGHVSADGNRKADVSIGNGWFAVWPGGSSPLS